MNVVESQDSQSWEGMLGKGKEKIVEIEILLKIVERWWLNRRKQERVNS